MDEIGNSPKDFIKEVPLDSVERNFNIEDLPMDLQEIIMAYLPHSDVYKLIR